MHFFDAVLKGLLLGLIMAISVGPTLFAVIKYSLNHSYRSGIAFILGVSISDIMYVTIANVAASWLEMMSGYERIIAYIGAAILIVVGLAGLIKKICSTAAKQYKNNYRWRTLLQNMAEWFFDKYH